MNIYQHKCISLPVLYHLNTIPDMARNSLFQNDYFSYILHAICYIITQQLIYCITTAYSKLLF